MSIGEATIKIWLESLDVAKSRGFRAHEIGGIVALVEAHRGAFVESWREYFG